MNNKANAEKVVNRILSLIDEGKPLPWVKPWSSVTASVTVINGTKTITYPCTTWNRAGRPYNGVNTYLPYGEYATFNQIKAEGGTVNKGAKSYPVVYWNFIEKTVTDKDGKPVTDKDGNEEIIKLPILKLYNVFNIKEQTNLEVKHTPEDITITVPVLTNVPCSDEGTDPAAETIIADYLGRNTSLSLDRYGISDEAFYSPTMDSVTVPNLIQFKAASEFYSTLFHELGHSTGHSSRLDRFSGSAASAAFGSENYSREELVAEATAATICNMLGLEDGNSFRNSAAYIKAWASCIKDDPMLYITAITRAQAAVNCILGADNI